MPAVAATPTRNTTVPAANKKPMNRTRKRISEYPFQPSAPQQTASSGSIDPCRKPILPILQALAVAFYRTAAVAKLGLARCEPRLFQFAEPADTIRLAKKASVASATTPTCC